MAAGTSSSSKAGSATSTFTIIQKKKIKKPEGADVPTVQVNHQNKFQYEITSPRGDNQGSLSKRLTVAAALAESLGGNACVNVANLQSEEKGEFETFISISPLEVLWRIKVADDNPSAKNALNWEIINKTRQQKTTNGLHNRSPTLGYLDLAQATGGG